MIEKAPDIGGPIERYILMAGPRLREPLGQEPRRGHGASGHQHAKPGALLEETIDQGEHRGCFADTCRMDPDERSRHALLARLAETLPEARGFFLAKGQAAREIKAYQRSEAYRDEAIKGEAQGHDLARCARRIACQLLRSS